MSEAVLRVEGLCKRYPSFLLSEISFSLRPGRITGFIGRNGAGKTTTLKSLLRLVQPDAGEVAFFGRPFLGNEAAAKQRLGFVSGGVDYYVKKPIRAITDITRRFYPGWDEAAYRAYLRRFSLEEGKPPAALSAGMRVKYALALALSHRAELLLLDEPTSGLDPVSRGELLDIFLRLAREEGVTILFSTHITSDLEHCADDILYIQKGRLVAQDTLEGFTGAYRLADFPGPPPPGLQGLLSAKPGRRGYEALLRAADCGAAEARPAGLADIMIHLEREEGPHAEETAL